MPGKKGHNQAPKQADSDFKFDLGGSGKPQLTKETQAALMPVLQQRLDKLIGKDSGYLETLPQSVQQRIKALKKLQTRHDELQEGFEKEMAALELKYQGLKDPLYSRRAEIVIGTSEPTAEELAGDNDEKEVKTEGKADDKSVKGIPEFWLLAFKHHFELEAMIHPPDEPIMKHITDIRVTFPKAGDTETFAIEFLFTENPFFEDKILSKTFVMATEGGSTMLEKVETSGIKWKAGKNVTVKMVAEKQGGGRGGRRGGRGGKPQQSRMVERPVDSFFHFFDPLEEQDDDEDEDFNDILEQDYELGMLIRTQIVQDAVKYFTGEVPMIEGDDDEEGEGEDDDAEEHSDDDDTPAPKKGKGKKTTFDRLNEDYNSEDDDDFDPKDAPAAQPGQAQPECKQQ